MAQEQNPFLLAADDSPALLPLLRANPALASAQDEHGYSLVHAAASYNHIDLLRTLIRDFHVDANLKDEDDETPLFLVETPEAARVLVEELRANISHKNSDGLTAKEKIAAEGDFPAVATYLNAVEPDNNDTAMESMAAPVVPDIIEPPPEGMKLTVGTMDQTEDIPGQANPDFRRRIEELAQRDDFNDLSGQADLRRLVEDAIVDQGLGDVRNVRSRQA